MRLDERSAGFFAIGLALARREPVVVITTSGTAAAELHAAVVEADLAGVPLVIVTADRPVELHGVGAPQTIDQQHLFGRSVRLFVDLPVAEDAIRSQWRSHASRLVAEATAGAFGPGPVHANVHFREPMVGPVGELPAGRADGAPWHVPGRATRLEERDLEQLRRAIDASQRPLIVAGGDELRRPGALVGLATSYAIPLVTDGRATRREPDGASVFFADQLVRVREFASRYRPDLVIRVGSLPSSKSLGIYLDELVGEGVPELIVSEGREFADPARSASFLYRADPSEVFDALFSHSPPARDRSWLESWIAADGVAAGAIEYCCRADPLSEPAVARCVLRSLGSEDLLVVSSSMPVRDLEWFGGATPAAPRVVANRGANGIDGVTSTVFGAAAGHEGRTVGLLGDLTFFHDLSGLVFGTEESVPSATLVVLDNGGGGIFSFLSYPDELDLPLFRRAFLTPQRPDPRAVASALRFPVAEASCSSELEQALQKAASCDGPNVIVVAIDPDRNIAVHGELAAAVRDALCATL